MLIVQPHIDAGPRKGVVKVKQSDDFFFAPVFQVHRSRKSQSARVDGEDPAHHQELRLGQKERPSKAPEGKEEGLVPLENPANSTSRK